MIIKGEHFVCFGGAAYACLKSAKSVNFDSSLLNRADRANNEAAKWSEKLALMNVPKLILALPLICH